MLYQCGMKNLQKHKIKNNYLHTNICIFFYNLKILSRIMKKKTCISRILQYHFIGYTIAIGGWLWEVLLFLVKEHKFVNRGFLYGPWLPVYGSGAVILSILYHFAEHKKASCKTGAVFNKMPEPIRIFLLCMLGGSIIELAIGWFLLHVFHQRYWDYTGNLGSVNGYICLYSALGFGLFGLLWIKWLSAPLIRVWKKLPFSIQFLIAGLLNVAFVTDVIFSLMRPNSGKNITF